MWQGMVRAAKEAGSGPVVTHPMRHHVSGHSWMQWTLNLGAAKDDAARPNLDRRNLKVRHRPLAICDDVRIPSHSEAFH